jgi:hypothetical protein
MEGIMTDKQWAELQKSLVQINVIAETSKATRDEIKDISNALNKVQVEFAELNVELFGKNKDNGMRGDIRKNTDEIEKLKCRTGNAVKTWVPVIICIITFIATVYMGISTSIQKDIMLKQFQTQQTTGSQNP